MAADPGQVLALLYLSAPFIYFQHEGVRDLREGERCGSGHRPDRYPAEATQGHPESGQLGRSQLVPSATS